MKHDITHILEAARPHLSEKEQSTLWSQISLHMPQPPLMFPFIWFAVPRHMALAFVVVLVVMSGGVSIVRADNARPGDALFPLDRALERLELRLAQTTDDKARVGVKHAEERITELRATLKESSLKESVVVSATSTSSSSYVSVSASVDALVRVMEESNMNETARERVYENLFIEIDPLSIDVRVGDSSNAGSRERIQVDRREQGETRIEIREGDQRTRIEKKDGQVRVRYGDDIDDDDNDVSGEVQGAETSEREDRRERRGRDTRDDD